MFRECDGATVRFGHEQSRNDDTEHVRVLSRAVVLFATTTEKFQVQGRMVQVARMVVYRHPLPLDRWVRQSNPLFYQSTTKAFVRWDEYDKPLAIRSANRPLIQCDWVHGWRMARKGRDSTCRVLGLQQRFPVDALVLGTYPSTRPTGRY